MHVPSPLVSSPSTAAAATPVQDPMMANDPSPPVTLVQLVDGKPLGEPTGDLDPFDGSAEPIIYMSENRMPVMMEFRMVIICVILVSLLLSLLVILPGVRRSKLTSFFAIFTIFIVGISILAGLNSPYWLTGSLQLQGAPYGSLTRETITGQLDVNIGLSWTNITLKGVITGKDTNVHREQVQTLSGFVDFNERFHWDEPTTMAREHASALRRGLPYPILTVTEYLSHDSDGFNWMRQLRQAGYFASIGLTVALVCHTLTVLSFFMLPTYMPILMQLTGALMMSTVWIYTQLIQSPDRFVIKMNGNDVQFTFGILHRINFFAGALCLVVGVLFYMIKLSRPDEALTFMDSEQHLSIHQRATISVATLDKKLNEDKSSLKTQESVIIPIGDMESKTDSNSISK